MRIRIASLAVVLLAIAPIFSQDWRIREPSLDGMTMTEWARALRHHDREVRSKAIAAFQTFLLATKTAIPPLVEALDDTDESMRNELAAVFLMRPDLCKITAPVAVRLLRDPNDAVRMTAIRILWAGDPQAFVALLEALDRSSETERHYLATALRNCGTEVADEDVPKVLARWKAQIRRAEWAPSYDNVAHSLKRVLSKSKAVALPMARKATRDPNPYVRQAALELCWELSSPEETRDLDRRALDDPSPLVRCEALRAIGVSETPDLFALAALREAIHDPDVRIHDAAALGLRSYRFASIEALPDLFALAGDPDPEVRFGVVVSFQRFPKDVQERGLAPLSHLFFDSDRWVRNAMRELALKVGSRDPEIREDLLEGMNETYSPYAHTVCFGLLKDLKAADRPALKNAILRMVREQERDTMRIALRGLAQLDPKCDEAIPILVERILSKGEVALVRELGQLGDAGCEAAVGLIEAAPPAVAEAILGEIWTAPQLVCAVSCAGLHSPHGSVREKTLSLLQGMASRGFHIGDARTAALLLPGVDDPDPATRKMVQQILKGITPTPNTVRMILRGLRDEDETVRESALDAIGAHRVFPQPVVDAIREASLVPGALGSRALRIVAENGLDDVTARRQLDLRVGAPGPAEKIDMASLVEVARRDGRGIDAIALRLDRETASGLDRDAVFEILGIVERVPGTRRSLLPALTYWACDWEPRIRQAAVSALGRLGTDATDAVPLLKARLLDESPAVADAAREALASVRGHSASPPRHARPCRYSCIW